jgi:hypothetical protein
MHRVRYIPVEEEKKVVLLYSYKLSHLTRFIIHTRKNSLQIFPYNIINVTDYEIE